MAIDPLPENRPQYPLAERLVDLFLDPRRLFRSLKRDPRVGGAAALSTVFTAATFLLMLPLAEVEVSPPLAGATFALGVVALWVYLGIVALSGRVFGGFVLVELAYRHWLALAAHCSFITLPIGLLQIGTIAWTSNPDLGLSLADLAAANSTGVAHAFLARVSLRNVAFLTLFSFGAAVFTGSSWSQSAAFLFGLWIGLWFMLSWFTTCGA